jgi:hypothetical protein
VRIATLETFSNRFVCFVRVTTDTGLVGVGSGDLMLGFAGHEPLFVGRDPTDIERHHAVRAGVMHSSGQRVIFIDADLAYPPEEIDKIVHALDEGAPAGRIVGGSPRPSRGSSSSPGRRPTTPANRPPCTGRSNPGTARPRRSSAYSAPLRPSPAGVAARTDLDRRGSGSPRARPA